MNEYTSTHKIKRFFSLLKQAIAGSEQDYTTGSIRKAVFLLAIPMIMEMMMESVFAVVDIFFVGKLGNEAVATVGLTESVLSLVYSVAIGLSMAATALVARRVGEKNLSEAAHAGMQTIVFAIGLSVIIAATGVYAAEDILRLMGANKKMIADNIVYTRIMFGGNIVIMLLFLINGIFRGAGDASIAMRSLWIANICNIILCPLLIYGWGPVPALGLKGAAIATTFGRGIGVLYQLYRLFIRKGLLNFYAHQLRPSRVLLLQIVKIGSTGTIQFLVSSASWIFLARLMADFHEAAMAGYQVSIRLLIFFLLPAWGMSNAAATLTGQNLGAGKPERAEQSVWTTAGYTMIFMVCVSLFFFLFGTPVVNFMNSDPLARHYAIQSLRIISLGYVFFGIEMVMMNAFNGAGDTRTPTYVNLIAFWLFQIPLAFFLSKYYIKEPKGVFYAILVSQVVAAALSYFLFKKGSWKTVKV
ncbi:MATE family efflux transporter [Mucilaginibacter xinganensis]|uniref:Multidrug-efflux transporter n=1 Tax=Mucilaginibacter xinganensis TaxID=1234841 RepID=A0A223NVX5_9SPHI|nr:MATE family efflux transporter [Mucilaginibacter xinganensis]ASU34007.1 MATE family efflux transporter [Mucilaginibacter xinganensis]